MASPRWRAGRDDAVPGAHAAARGQRRQSAPESDSGAVRRRPVELVGEPGRAEAGADPRGIRSGIGTSIDGAGRSADRRGQGLAGDVVSGGEELDLAGHVGVEVEV